jgi:hypothetical protein
MGRWLVVRVVAWGLRGGASDDEIERAMRSRFRHRDMAWRWEVIGDAHLLNDRRQVRREYKAWRAGAR